MQVFEYCGGLWALGRLMRRRVLWSLKLRARRSLKRIQLWWAFYRGFRIVGRSARHSALSASRCARMDPPDNPDTLFGYPIVWKDGPSPLRVDSLRFGGPLIERGEE